MVNAGRIACIFTPFVLTLGALACLTLVFLSGSTNNGWINDQYFALIDLSNFTTAAAANLGGGSNISSLAGALESSKQALGLKDYYSINLRNYCSWNGDDKYSTCSSEQAIFWFNPVAIWGLNANTTEVSIDDLLPKSLRAGLNTYESVSKAMSVAYIIAIAAAALTILVGISAIFSRWGSFATTFFASATAIFLFAASIMATALFATLKGVLNKELEKEYGIVTSAVTGTPANRVYIVTWIGTAFAVGSAFFWLLSVCCCSGRSPYHPGAKDARRTRAEKTPYTYERVGSPYLGPQGGQAVPLTNMGNSNPSAQRQTAYEPFRPQQM